MTRIRIMAASGFFGLLIWILDVIVEVYQVPGHSFGKVLFNIHRPHDLFMRVVIVAMALLFGGVLSRVVESSRQDLAASEENLRITLQSIGDAVIATDLEGKITRMNSVAEKLTGWEMAEARGRPLEEVFHIINAFTRERVENPAARVMQTGKVVGLANHTLLLSRSGDEFQIEDSAAPIRDAGGKKRGVVLVFRDVTEEYRREQLLRNTLNALPHSFLVINPDTFQVEIANPAAGFTPENGQTTTCHQLTHGVSEPCGGEEHPCPLQRVLESKQSEMVEHIHLGPKGEKQYVEVHAHPILDHQGRVKEVIEYSLDITQRRKAEQSLKEYSETLEDRVEQRTWELQEAQERLVRRERLAVLGQLAGGIGHELRNPLGVMSNAVYFLDLLQPEASGKVKEYLDILEGEIHTSEKIVADLMDFARLKEPEREAVDVRPVLTRMLDREAVPEGIEVELESAGDLPAVHADPDHLVQILSNLVRNACQAMGEEGQLTLRAFPQDGRVVIEVEDTGEGIRPEDQEKIFQPLFTTKARGIGLGLALSKKLARGNRSELDFESRPGEGSTFRLRVPVREK